MPKFLIFEMSEFGGTSSDEDANRTPDRVSEHPRDEKAGGHRRRRGRSIERLCTADRSSERKEAEKWGGR